MIQKIKSYLLTTSTALLLLVPTVGITAVASAATGTGTGGNGCKGISDSLAEGVNSSIPGGGTEGGGVNCNATGVDDSAVKTLGAKIVNTFSIIVGIASVIMIIYGGFRYITSGGESGRVGAAKNALLYAIVGLVIVALAQLIIHFVLSQAANVNTAPGATAAG